MVTKASDLSRPDPSQRRDTKAAILRAATQAFVAAGPAGARVDAIAAAAGVNKRMLYHHFGDKQGLYLAVLQAAAQGDQISSDRARLLAWEGLAAPRDEGARTAMEAEIAPLQEPVRERSKDAKLYALLQTALAVFPHVFGPELERLTGLVPGSRDCEAALAELTEQVQRLDPATPSQTSKTKVRLRARSRPSAVS